MWIALLGTIVGLARAPRLESRAPSTIEPIWIGAIAALALAAWGLYQAFHVALLRGLRAPRVEHDPPIAERRLANGSLQPVPLHGAGGRRLAAWLALPDPPPSGPLSAVLVMHGWGANASTMWPVLEPLLGAAMAVMLLDARCHGDSDDEDFTSMPRFAEDIEAGLGWLRADARIDSDRLALIGHSVGAAAALLHASGRMHEQDPLTAPAVRAVVSVSAFAHPGEVMRRFLAEHRIPYTVLGWAILRHVQRVIGTSFERIAPLNTIREVRCPVLLVHGVRDDVVPFGDALRLNRALPGAELLAVDGDHDLRAALAPHAAEIVGFLRRAMNLEGHASSRRSPVQIE